MIEQYALYFVSHIHSRDYQNRSMPS